MTTKPKALKYRIRRATPLTQGLSRPAEVAETASTAEAVAAPLRAVAGGPRLRPASMVESAPPDDVASPALVAAEQDMDTIRAEGLTGRQLRMARRVAQKHGLQVTSDFDAVSQLRARGIDPFQRSSILELVQPDSPEGEDAPALQGKRGRIGPGQPQAAGTPQTIGRIQLPQTMPQGPRNLPSTERVAPSERRASEIMKIQKDLARRRRRRMALLVSRLAVFVMLPTFLAGWYFYIVATPMFATKSEFVIQQAESAAAAGLGNLFSGTSMATQQDSMTVQSYLTSRSALQRLDEEFGFKAHFSQPQIDVLQRLDADASNEDAYAVYQDRVRISYDPTEGIVKMEVVAADPQTSQQFSEALIDYAEEQVDQLTQRLREDQMAGARASYEQAETRRAAALAEWLRIQQDVQQIDPVGETAARTQQISVLESERQQLQLELQTRLSVARPNAAQVEALRSQIANIETLIANLRTQMTEASVAGSSLAQKNTELRLAEENYTFQTVLVQQALTQMEQAQIEANRQVRYLSLGVEPVAPDEATYPRAFENTLLAFAIFAGLYLMLSLTASILREQVTS